MKVDTRSFTKHDAAQVLSMLETTEELHVGRLTYSEKAY